MGNSRHLLLEDISALADGELTPLQLRIAREHVSQCQSCSGTLARFTQLERDLQQPPVLTCAEALPLINASADGEAEEADSSAARRHLQICRDCRVDSIMWTTVGASLRMLPHGAPSVRVDKAIAQLGRRRAPASIIPAFAARGLIAGTAVLAIVLSSLMRGTAPLPATQPEANAVVVAAVQEIVFSAKTSTLYVLDKPGAAVDARDAATNALKAHIDVGGRPTALALNESTDVILVLDAQEKRVTEIDGSTNKVISSSAVDLAGTPTSIGVDPASSKIIVTSTTTTSTATGAKDTTGSVAVLDSTTKKVESVREVTVSPQTVVFDAAKGRAALISAQSTTLVDDSYHPIATIGGGVSGAFAQGNDRLAVLSAKGAGSLITYTGPAAPASLDLAGSPRNIISLPDGGFLALLDMGGRSRVSYIAPDGHEAGNVDLAIGGRDLIYDPVARRFSVVSGADVVSADVPQRIAAAAPTSSPTQAPTSAASSASPAASPAASASPSATPAVAPSTTPNPLSAAQSIAPNIRRIDLPGGRQPILVSKSGERLWVLDQNNGVDTVDLSTGDVFTIASLPRSAQVGFWTSGRRYAYGIDARAGALYEVDAVNEAVRTVTLSFRSISAVAVASDDRLWIGTSDTPYLFVFDPRTGGTDSFDLGPARIAALTTDDGGRVLYSDDSRSTVGAFDPRSGALTEVAVARRAKTTALVVDRTSTLWLGTAAGELYSVRGGAATLERVLTRPVSSIALDSSGLPWYLAPLPEGQVGSGYGALRGADRGGSIAGPVSSLAFSALGYAWLADPVRGFYIVQAGGG